MNQNITYDCHLVIGGCQCSVLDARLGMSIGGALAAISSPASSDIPEETAFGQEHVASLIPRLNANRLQIR